MHIDDGMQQGVQQAASVLEDKDPLAAEVDMGQGSVVCGRFKPAPDGAGMEQNERESPSKMSRQVLGTRPLLIGTQPASQHALLAKSAELRSPHWWLGKSPERHSGYLDGGQTDAEADGL